MFNGRVGKIAATGFIIAGAGLVGLLTAVLGAMDAILQAINLEALPAEWVAPVSFLALLVGGLMGFLNLRDEPEPGSMDAYRDAVEDLPE